MNCNGIILNITGKNSSIELYMVNITKKASFMRRNCKICRGYRRRQERKQEEGVYGLF